MNLSAADVIHLKVPDLNKEKIIGYSTGLRPYRKSGIRLETERIGDTLLIHDYGHGGTGISLSWGCAKEAVNMMEKSGKTDKSVSILGAGVIGLTTAHILKDLGYEVTVYAREFTPLTTSDKAAGIFSAHFSLGTMDESWFTHIYDISYKNFYHLATSLNPEFRGIFLLPGYLQDDQYKITDVIPESHCIVECNGVKKVCQKRLDIIFDLTIYMNDLFDKAKQKGIIFEQRNFQSIDDVLILKDKVIFNCTGLGSRELFNDADLIPVKGHQVILQSQSDIQFVAVKKYPDKNSFFALIPWKTQLMIGGSLEEGVDDLTVNFEIVNILMQQAAEFFNVSF